MFKTGEYAKLPRNRRPSQFLKNILKIIHYFRDRRVAILLPSILCAAFVAFIFLTNSEFVVLFAGLGIAICLFIIRSTNKLLYGCVEVSVGLYMLASSLKQEVEYFPRGFTMFPKWGNVIIVDIALLQTVSAIYVIIRGFDNIDKYFADAPSKWIQEHFGQSVFKMKTRPTVTHQ